MKESITLENVEYGDIYNRPDLITSLLYKKLLQKLEEAETHIHVKDYYRANHAIQFAQDVIVRLGAGLKYEAGILTDQIEWLYQYWVDRLREANFRKDASMIAEVKRIAIEIDDAWTIAMVRESDSARATHTPGKRSLTLNPYQRQAIEKELLEQDPERFHQQK